MSQYRDPSPPARRKKSSLARLSLSPYYSSLAAIHDFEQESSCLFLLNYPLPELKSYDPSTSSTMDTMWSLSVSFGGSADEVQPPY